MGCSSSKEEKLDGVIRLYESKLTVLNAEIDKLEREKMMITDRCTLLQANESVDAMEPTINNDVEQTKF